MVGLGYGSDLSSGDEDLECGYRIHISGNTLLVDDFKKTPELYTEKGNPIDLMLIHLGGTKIPARACHYC
jgi:hypothetical protein